MNLNNPPTAVIEICTSPIHFTNNVRKKLLTFMLFNLQENLTK